DSKRDESDSFKRRMESLHDPMSTNLYMEGLPLSIDEPTLAALVSPHRISSSRFFQTRLSHPPRIIAFVRLETRVGAEEVIERLHGRMVRGWNDTGSRISVRFADTAEQRELRRADRAVKDGDTSASRLTIAQAALLNLRGQELRQAAKLSTLPVIGERRRQPATDHPYNDFPSNGIQLPNPQLTRPTFEVDYSLAPGRSLPAQRIQSPSTLVNPAHTQPYSRSASRNVDPSMTILLDGLRGNGGSFRGSNTAAYDHYPQQHNLSVQSPHYVPDDYSVRPPPVHARSGYTATEEFIMRAHAESRRRPAPLDLAMQARSRRENEVEAASVNIATGVR
ncbi:rCop c3, partial [Macrolepiota fuliginosa MF-IS2]